MIRISEEETSHPGFFYAMAKARFEMEPKRGMMDLQRIVEFLAKLAASGMSDADIASRGYDFALAWLLSDAECNIRKGESVPSELKCKLMEQAANLTMQSTGMLEVSRRSLAKMKGKKQDDQR